MVTAMEVQQACLGSRRRLPSALFLTLAGVTLLAACTAHSQVSMPSAPTTSQASAARHTALTTWPNTDLPGQDCGTFVRDQGERLPVKAAKCIAEAARSKRQAHLAETGPSVEGAPITTHYLTDEAGRTTVLDDARKDVMGYPKSWPRDDLDNLNIGPATVTTCKKIEQQRDAVLMKSCTPAVYLWPLRSRSYRSVNWDALNLWAVEGACGFKAPYVDRPDLVGLTPARAEEIEKVDHRILRVIAQDGTCKVRADNLLTNRVNVSVEDDKITWAQMG